MQESHESVTDEERRSKKVIKIALIAFSIVELVVMVAIIIKQRIG